MFDSSPTTSLVFYPMGMICLVSLVTLVSPEMEKVVKIAEINFRPKKISTKKWPKNDSKLPKMVQK